MAELRLSNEEMAEQAKTAMLLQHLMQAVVTGRNFASLLAVMPETAASKASRDSVYKVLDYVEGQLRETEAKVAKSVAQSIA
jgi:hypothetical protein